MSENRRETSYSSQDRSHLLQESLLKVMTKIKIDSERDTGKGQRYTHS
jgi:hypothetical protein